MGDSDPLINSDDVEQGRNTQCAQGSTIGRREFKELFKLFENKNDWDDENQKKENIKAIEDVLRKDKIFLTSRVNMKYLIHAAKYNKIHFLHSQDIVNTIVDIGYESFQFQFTDFVTSDNFHALFFVAAKGDYEKLKDIVAYFKLYDVTKIYDTIYEGETVLSFMIKFGNYFQGGFLECFKLMVEQNIDIERVDYFNRNISNVIRTEIGFLNLTEERDKDYYIAKLNEMNEIINQFSQSDQDLNSNISGKYKLFQSLIKNDNNLSNLIEKDWIDADDGQNTLLQLAIIKNNLKVTKELLTQGANPNHVVEFGNKEVPLVLAAKLKRENIFKELLKHKNVKITNEIFSIFVTKIESKLFNYLLESKIIDINVEHKGKTPLFYAISRKNRDAVQSLLRKGSSLNDLLIENINPQYLEDYLNSCVRDDTFNLNMEETKYKPLLVFDFFVNSSEFGESEKSTEVAVIRNLGNNKRLKYLLEHPLVNIFMILKWHRVKVYYTVFLLLKSIFYIIVDILLFSHTIVWGLMPALAIQGAVVSYNFREFKREYKRYTLHFILEILILAALTVVYLLTFIILIFKINLNDFVVQTSAVIIIFSSLSILLSIGYHFSLSKWMAMAKRVLKNFISMLLFFMIPIIGFAASFTLLNSLEGSKKDSQEEGNDFDNLPRSFFRTIIMLGGDIGDKKFSGVGGYVIFIFFTILMAIILLNFWTGVAVSDIKEIEEQSIIVAFQNVIIFIESVESMYNFFYPRIFQSRLIPKRLKIMIEEREPFLKKRIWSNRNGKGKFHYSLNFYINSQPQFPNSDFEDCKIPTNIILKIKSIFEEKESTPGKTFKQLIVKLDALDKRLEKVEQLLHFHASSSQQKATTKNK